ncbi:hypothetical protein ES703_123573 [subsurface metagenome]
MKQMRQMAQDKFKEIEIGKIPEGWEVKSISEVSEIIPGGTPKTAIKEYWDGNIKWASARDVANCNSIYIHETERKITKEGVENSAAKILPKDTIVITSRGTIGKIAILPEQMSFNQTCYGLKVIKELSSLYLYYELKNSMTLFDSVSYGTVFDTITMRTFDELKISIPPFSEQKAIAKILSKLDAKIELNRQMNKTLEKIAQAIFKHWFIDFDFPDEEGKPYKSSGGKMVESGTEFGRIPAGWRIGNLMEIINNYDSKRIPLSSRERDKRQGSYPYYGATSIMDYIDDYIFDGEYLLMGEDGTVVDHKGFPILQYGWGKFWVNNHAHVIKGKKGIPLEYIFLLLKHTNVFHIVTGAVQRKINQRNMNNLKVIIPPVKTLVLFNNIIPPFIKKCRINIDEKKFLSQIRDSLLPRLMSGKIRVNYDKTTPQG